MLFPIDSRRFLRSGDAWDPAQPIAVALPALMAPEVNKAAWLTVVTGD